MVYEVTVKMHGWWPDKNPPYILPVCIGWKGLRQRRCLLVQVYNYNKVVDVGFSLECVEIHAARKTKDMQRPSDVKRKVGGTRR